MKDIPTNCMIVIIVSWITTAIAAIYALSKDEERALILFIVPLILSVIFWLSTLPI